VTSYIQARTQSSQQVLEIKRLGKYLRLKKGHVGEQYRVLHNEALRDLYRSPCNVSVVKCVRPRWARRVARMRQRMHRLTECRSSRRSEENIQLEDQESGGKTALIFV
jgi:hypothetical protein